MIHIETGISLVSDKLPKLKNLDQWLSSHQKYTVDVTTLMLILASSVSSTPTNLNANRSKSVSNKESAQSASLGNLKISNCNSANSKTLKNLTKTKPLASSNAALNVSSSRSSTEPCSSKSVSSTKSALQTSSNYTNTPSTSKLSNTPAFSLENALQIPVVHKNTGVLLSMEKWPLLANLSTWLDKNLDFNVQQNHASLVKVKYFFIK